MSRSKLRVVEWEMGISESRLWDFGQFWLKQNYFEKYK